MSEIFNFQKLYRAYLDCRRTKRKTLNALKFEWKLERNLFWLLKELQQKTYKPGRSICFAVREPTPREIFAASFKDRVVHHLLINEIIKAGEKNFIFDSFACRKNKGTHKAVKRLSSFMRKETRKHTEVYYLQLDIAGFFMNIEHNILYSILKKLVSKQKRSKLWKKDILWLAKTIIFHQPTRNYKFKGDLSLFNFIPFRKSLFYSAKNKGLPIGNYSSQFFANLYLNKLDQFVKRRLKCRPYVRYVDDLILIDKDKEKLKCWRREIGKFLRNNLKMELNLAKTQIQPVKKGIDFLGYFVKPKYLLVRKKVVSRLKDKLFRLKNRGFLNLNKVLAAINSYFGHFRHAKSFKLRRNIYVNHLGKLKEKLIPKPGVFSLRMVQFCLGFFFSLVFFNFALAGGASAATYYPSATLTSTNLLYGESVATINKFGYNASSIPVNTTLKAQFSQNGLTWKNSSGVTNGWDTLLEGDHTSEDTALDLSGLAWGGGYFYYKIQFETSDTSTTPVLDEIIVYYSSGTPAGTYYPSATLVSTNLLSGQTVNTIDGFGYNLSAKPDGSGATIQFSQDNTNWYDSAGTLGGTETLNLGSNTIDLSSLGWSGANFYYRVQLTANADQSETPVLDEVTLYYNAPSLSTSPLQLKNDGVTRISNQGYTNETNVKLQASATDTETSETISLFFELVNSDGSFTSPVKPSIVNSCSSATAYADCASKIWYVTSSSGDYSSTAYTGTVSITGLSDGVGYKWQVKSCDSTSSCSNWSVFNTSAPNFTVDITAPGMFELDSPADNQYSGNERPTFKWKTASDAVSGLSKYVLEVDNPSLGWNQPSGDFRIDDIPASRTTDYETDKYTIHYENFSDSDPNNNYISVFTKPYYGWAESENEGKLREGKVSWKVKAVDKVGNESSLTRNLLVDKSRPQLKLTQVNNFQLNSNDLIFNFQTTDRNPTIYGKIIDPLAGGDPAENQTEEGPRVASGPKQLEIKVEKIEKTFGLIPSNKLVTLYTLNLDKPWYVCDDKEIPDNSRQKCDKYLPFVYTSKENLERGTHKIILIGKDKAENLSAETTLILNITTFAQITTQEEKKAIEEEIKELPKEEQEKVKEELEITKPAEPAVLEKAAGKTSHFVWVIINGTANIVRAIARTAGDVLALVSDKTGKALAFIGNKTRQTFAFMGVPNQTSRFVQRITDTTKDTVRVLARTTRDGIANVVFKVGEKTQDISEAGGFAIVKFGYLFVNEPTKITDVQVEIISSTSVKITWTTNHPANAKINWGYADGIYEFENQTDKRTTYHEFILTNLKPDTEYHYEVMSHNKNYVYDANRKFRTPAENKP